MAKKPVRRTVPASAPVPRPRVCPVRPDPVDLRDRPYMPAVHIHPAPALYPRVDIPVLDQKTTNACTGFALASVIYHLQRAANLDPELYAASPYMLYSMARRYDEFPGNSPKESTASSSEARDTGSSLRGAMRGWHKHGACAARLWPDQNFPKWDKDRIKDDKDDWWYDAVKRPLGAYYRIDIRSIADMHVALNEVGILYASAECHSGWFDKSVDKSGKRTEEVDIWWQIPTPKTPASDGGHAFVIIGYTPTGFIIQNSWSQNWGTRGKAILTYDDWLENGMDCWVAQLGVVTDIRLKVGQAKSLRIKSGVVQLAEDTALRNHEIGAFIVDMENNGRLSNTGEFRTREDDLKLLVTDHLDLACEKWKLPPKNPVDIAIYAHGGLTSERNAADTAARWIPALYERKIFPIFLMWETDLYSTLKNRAQDLFAGQYRTTGGFLDHARKWYNERLERLLATVGSAVWGEMKQNAAAISSKKKGGGMLLYEACQEARRLNDPTKFRLHLIGHSAGAIVHSHIIKRLGDAGWKFATVNFLAPAVRVDQFTKSVVPAIKNKTVAQYNQFHLTDEVEQKDPTCKAILGYSRSLLYLVSQSFEQGVRTPILGLQKDFSSMAEKHNLPNVAAWSAPGRKSNSTTHGGFDDDATTMKAVIDLIRKKKPGA